MSAAPAIYGDVAPIPFAGLTAATVRREWLEPTMDVVALLGMAIDRARQSLGIADQTVTDLRRAELNGGPRTGVPAKQIARELRDPLDVLRNTHARTALRDAAPIAVLALTVPRAQLLAPAVERNLGRARFALLRDLVDLLHECGAPDQQPGRRNQQRGRSPC